MIFKIISPPKKNHVVHVKRETFPVPVNYEYLKTYAQLNLNFIQTVNPSKLSPTMSTQKPLHQN